MAPTSNLLANVKKRQAEYFALSASYDEELAAAHNTGGWTAEALVHLKRAGEIAPSMLEALKWYQEAVALLVEAFSAP